MNIHPSAAVFGFLCALLPVSGPARAAAPASEPVGWNSPGAGSSDSMPLGNGSLGVNAWIERDGMLRLYISSTDAWSGNGRLLKLGKAEIRAVPFEIGGDVPFRQVLDHREGSIRIAAGGAENEVRVRLWVDAFAPAVRAEIESAKPFEGHVRLAPWRLEERIIESAEELHSAYGLANAPFPVTVEPDTVVDGPPDRLVWYHRNEQSIWPLTLELQGLAGFMERSRDPLLHRTFGGAVLADSYRKAGPTELRSETPLKRHRITIWTHTAQTETAGLWTEQLEEMVETGRSSDRETAWRNHKEWWNRFWDRSWLRVEAADPADEEAREAARTVTRGYHLQRFVTAGAGRGGYPIKFNGSIFTVDPANAGLDFDADYRRWGGPYWFQNTRLIYWPLLKTGDFEMIHPLFDMYADALPLARYRTNAYFGHGGAYFPETMYFWGACANDNYGWDREGKHPSVIDNRYIRYYWSNNLELLNLMLDYFLYTRDGLFVQETLRPMAAAVLEFFDEHFPREEDGTLRVEPAQALETWQRAVNPVTVTAGLREVIPKLLALPADSVSDAEKQSWEALMAILPPMPLGGESGEERILPGSEYDERHNSENPELYPVFPYRIYGVGKPDLDIALRTFETRMVKRTGGWSQDAIQAACLGLTDTARDYVVQNFSTWHEGSRFPAFWGPNFDWIPDQDHGNAAMIALQAMLMQCEGDEILLFPAWPPEWNVEFKLHAPRRTVVEGSMVNGELVSLNVSPPWRRGDVRVLLPDSAVSDSNE